MVTINLKSSSFKKYIFFFLLLLTSCQQRENRQVGSSYHNNPFSPLRIEMVDGHLYVYNANGGQPTHAESCPCKSK
jgi:hypothetical protein